MLRPVSALILLLLSPLAALAGGQSEVDIWQTFLKPRYFPDTPISEDDQLIELRTPYRAEDAAFTPVSIRAKLPQQPERYIERMYVIIDRNPEPLAGVFTFTPEVGRADLGLRVRVDGYTPLRVVAVLNNGEHHMVSNFVKAQGGCSAPLGSDYAEAMARIGEMTFRTVGKPTAEDALVGQLLLRHPNITGMQKDQKTQLIRPAHFVKSLKLYYAGKLIMMAETGISISEDPSLRFFFRPKAGGELRAEVTDSEGRNWEHAFRVAPPSAKPVPGGDTPREEKS